MKKNIKIISVFLLSFIVFMMGKLDAYALSGRIELTSDKNEVNVNDTINVKVKISEDGNSLGSWQMAINHSNNLSLVSGDENIVDVIGDTFIKEKEYELSYKAVSSGEASINISNEKIIDYDTEEEITITKNIVKINVKSSQQEGSKFTERDGHKYYYINGVMQKGVVEIDGNKYLFGVNSGILYYGWATTPDGSKYYSDENGVLKSGIVEIDGNKYLFGVYSSKLYYGWATTPDGNKYYSDQKGIIKTGIQEINKDKYYFSNDGIMQKGVVEIDDNKYLFGVNSGKLYYGWATTPDGNKYYSDQKGIIKTGIQEIDDKTYYFSDDGIMQTGIQEINKDKYYFSNDGIMQKGVVEIDGNKYLFGVNSGILYYGWATTPDGSKYYSDENGVLKSGIVEIDGNKYLFGVYSSKLYYGWATTPDGSKYYSDENGIMQNGIIEIKGKKYLLGIYSYKLYYGWATTPDGNIYYSDKNGIMQNGVVEINGKKYLFGVYSYRLYYGWATTPDGSKYYSGENGELKSGITEMGEKKYLFGVYSCKLYYGWATLPNGDKYYTNNEGIIQTGIQVIDGVSYNFGSDGKLQSGYQNINGKVYYYYSDGSIAKGIVKIQGERNYFDFTTGELLKRNVKSIIDVSYGQSTIDWDTLWNSGQIDGVIIRVGYGTSKTDNPVLDSYFAYNIAAVKRLGIPYSVYIFGYAQTTYAAEKEATFVANTLNSYGANNLSMPIFYDAEISYWNGLDYTSDVYTNTITSFANKLKSLGFNDVGVYGSYSWFTDANGRLNSQTIKNYPLWVAQYYRECSYKEQLIGWQYTSSGLLPGIPSRVDMNIFF